ncbi:hypothetical protein BDY17DRAFT_320348 [Neohortaea acidophila]|uniref:C2H2-type domain-containing protein n=1 Tax=Neohortaea acidophila TaxID=245834 RepID=A0A6A6Q760_9PEZI|nr:uncharacterized protein BDY17DRAFT_320348 [Neohortaea acidophila]KAF2487834.1 hypothetical protein BDY17DRAFT_320348 [Neohortaea acidophila]
MSKAYPPSSTTTRTTTTSTAASTPNHDASLSAILASHLHHDHPQYMDGRQSDYTHPGLTTPSAQLNGYQQSEGSPAGQTSAVQYHQQGPLDHKPPTYSASATPSSDYGSRSSSYPEYAQRGYADGQSNRYPAPATPGHAAAMAQTSSPSQSLSEAHRLHGRNPSNMTSDGEVPIDPSIAQSSPSYPPPHNYSPYPPQHDMPQYAGQPMAYGRPDWAGQYQQPMYGHSPVTSGAGAPNMVAHTLPRPPAGGHPLSTVYSFVPIPGAQQHKRPRRRYEEIERMYKCGWNGCEKAYGTLNHLNAHVTMQSHGTKRTPEEFKEIRKEWKAKKKEEDNQRKQEEERQRQDAARNGQDSQPPPGQYGQPGMMPHQMGGPQLPPIGYQPAAQGQYTQPQQIDGAPQYANGQMYAQGYPQSPYGHGQGGLPYQQHQAPPQQYHQQ